MNFEISNLPWPLLLLGLELPAILALVDCTNRPPDHFDGGADDRKAWQKWLVVAIVTVPLLVGYLLIAAYYHVVIRKNSPTARGG